MPIKIETTELKKYAPTFHAGDEILLSGIVYTARDAAHKRFFAALDSVEALPIDIYGATIYYAGPTPEKYGMPIGSCGPTTSSRMDIYSPKLLDMGLAAMIGKGPRSEEVCKAIVRNGAVYLCAIGGAGAIAAKSVKALDVVAYPELGCESVKRLQIENFPLFCGICCDGSTLFN